MDPAPSLEMPPRAPWEEPPPGGWGSSVPLIAYGGLRFGVGIAAVLAANRIVAEARHMGRHRLHGGELWLVIGLWLGAAILLVGLARYLFRRLGGMAVLLAMATDYGRVARLRGRPPVWLDAPPPRALRVVHLSDLHLAESPRARLVERAVAAGNAAFATLLANPALDEADVVLITGDVTDRGADAAWRGFSECIERRGLADKVVLCPGNHDLSHLDFFDRPPRGALRLAVERRRLFDRTTRTDRFAIVQLANLYKFARAFAATGGGRRGTVLASAKPAADGAAPDDREVIGFGEAFAAVERLVEPLLLALPGEPVPRVSLRALLPLRGGSARAALRAYERRIESARALLLGLFPIAVPITGRDGVDAVVFVLNSSTRVSRHPATNAVGYLGRAQCRRLSALARFMPQRLRLVSVHHHTARRGEERGVAWKDRLFATFQTLGDSFRLVRFCNQREVRAVFNGHRHLSYQLRLPGGTVLLAAPSSTLGDELSQDPRPQLERYDIAALADPPTVGIHRLVVRPSPTVTAPPSPPPGPPSG